MRRVCGDGHREVIERSMGKPAYEQAVRESRFFFRDEVPAATQWKFGAAEAARILQPVLIVEGGEGRKHGLLSQQSSMSDSALVTSTIGATIFRSEKRRKK